MIAQWVPTEELAARFAGYEWQVGWALAFAANLPVPLLFGCVVVAKGGLFGMLAGIAAFWLAGAAVVAWVPRLREALVVGGLLFAPSQFLPVLQVLAGIVAVELFDTGPEPMSELNGFLATVATGGQLLLLALAVCLVLHVLGRLVDRTHRDRP